MTPYGWTWAEIRATFLQTLGPNLIGAGGLGVIFSLIGAVASGHVTALTFGWTLLFWAGVAIAGTVFFTLFFVLTGMWTASRRARRRERGAMAPHKDSDEPEYRLPGR